MKYGIPLLFISMMLLMSACGQDAKKSSSQSKLDSLIPPQPLGWVSDFEKIFTSGEVAYLDSMIAGFEAKTSNEIAVVTLKLDSGSIGSVEEWNQLSLRLFSQWGVGKKEKNNGLGILISVNLRRVRIETGFGIELKLTNEEAKSIIDDVIIPSFKEANYFRGLVNALREIFKEIQ